MPKKARIVSAKMAIFSKMDFVRSNVLKIKFTQLLKINVYVLLD